MRAFWIVFLSIPILVFQNTFLSHIAINGAMPDLYFLLAVFIALYGPKEKVYVLNWLMGLIKDCLSETALGTWAMLFLLVTFLILHIRDLIVKENIAFQFGTVFAAIFVANILYGISIVYFYSPYGFWHAAFKSGIIAFYTALAAPFFYMLLYSLRMERLR